MSHQSDMYKHEIKNSVIHGKTQQQLSVVEQEYASDSTTAAQPYHSLPTSRTVQTLQALLLSTLTFYYSQKTPCLPSTPCTRTSTPLNRPHY